LKLYHGTSIGGLRSLKPHQADHDQPYIYLSLLKAVASFYMVNAVERPYYWFPYGFTELGIPIYEELYPNALKEISANRLGFIYMVETDEQHVAPFRNIPHSRISTKELEIIECTRISDCYSYFEKEQKQGNLIINRFESKSEDDLERWHDLIAKYLEDKAFIKRPRCSYSLFIKEKFPHIWDRYETKMKKKDEHLELEQTTLNAGTT
jgi:hypothetical protein